MSRWLAACACALFAAPALPADAPRPNVLFVVADDLNCDLGCYGHKLVRSPNIDRLAARAVRFDRAYCQYPVCNPSRTSLLSGRRPASTGVVDNVTPTRAKLAKAVFLPQYFRQKGYTTIKIGKIYHTGDAFEDPASWDTDVRETAEAKKPPKGQVLEQAAGVVLNAADGDTYDGKVARRAVEYLEKAGKGDKPLFLAVGFRRPHTPYIAPKKYFDLYPPDRLPLPDEPAAHLKKIPPLALTYDAGKSPRTERFRGIRQAYWASVSFMDAQVGVLLDALDRLEMSGRTIVVFVSDHGYHLGEHGGLWHKMTLFEECARVPLLVAVPGKKGGAVSRRLVELVDLYPTLAELCRLPEPEGVEGTSFAPLLDSPRRGWKKAAFTEVSRGAARVATKKLDPDKMGRSVRTERWRYTRWHDGTEELYDHDRDPREYRNLAGDAEHAKVAQELRAVLEKGWRAARPGS